MYTTSSNFGTGNGPRLGGGRSRRRSKVRTLAISTVVVLGAGWGGCALDPTFDKTETAGADPRAQAARQIASLDGGVPLDPSLDPSMIEPSAGTDQPDAQAPGTDQSAALPEAAAVDPSATIAPSQNYRIDPLLPEPMLEDSKRRTDSVAYARERSGIKLFGQPWRWWSEARG